MAVAIADDVATALGRPLASSAEELQVEWWLDGVELAIASQLGDVSLLDQATLVYVEAEAVAAKARRHGTLESSVTVSVDDASVTRRYENPVTDADITDQWWALLGSPRRRAISMQVTGGWREP
jgi:hypothetical protein